MSEKLWSDWTDDIKENTKQIAELEKRVDGEVTEMKDNYAELKDHDIFKIWNSVRKGGKTTLDAILMDNHRIKKLESVLKEMILDDPMNDKMNHYLEQLSAKDEREAGISRIKPKARERPCYNDDWCPSDCQGDAEEPCTTYQEQASGGERPYHNVVDNKIEITPKPEGFKWDKDKQPPEPLERYVISHCEDFDEDGECSSLGGLCMDNMTCGNKKRKSLPIHIVKKWGRVIEIEYHEIEMNRLIGEFIESIQNYFNYEGSDMEYWITEKRKWKARLK